MHTRFETTCRVTIGNLELEKALAAMWAALTLLSS